MSLTASQRARVINTIAPLFMPVWEGRVSDWCAANLSFNEPKLSGPFTFAGREYMREPLDDWSNEEVTDQVMCFGTRTGKTRIIFGGLGWKIKHSPTRALWTMPSTQGTGGAQNVSRTRFQPMIKASQTLAEHIPTGARRHDFKSLQMIINGSIIDLTGVNSPGNLAGNPCDTVIQDEVDKYQRRGESEADPSALADQRCKEFSTPKRVKTSTPTIPQGKIWQELLKSDLRRRFMPCPFCEKEVIFAWSEQFTMLPKTGAEAYVRWDDEHGNPDAARNENRTWDLDKVMLLAHAKCPHCGGRICDEHKVAMDAKGVWRPTQRGAPGYRGYHLPSMYSVSKETTFGNMAKRFLLAKKGLTGVQDFINSDLAEPYMSQDMTSERIEVVSKELESSKSDGWVGIMSVDVQQKAPYFWYVVRKWKDGNSEGIVADNCDRWEDLREIQLANGVQDAMVIVDSGFGAKSDAEVYRNCAAFGEIKDRREGLPLHVGWMPARGMPGRKRWRDTETGIHLPYYLKAIDPFMGTSKAGALEISLFEFSSDFFRDILQPLRESKGGYSWAISSQMDNDVYRRHMNSHKKHEDNKWVKRHRYWPDHLNDCEIEGVALAMFFGLFKIEDDK